MTDRRLPKDSTWKIQHHIKERTSFVRRGGGGGYLVVVGVNGVDAGGGGGGNWVAPEVEYGAAVGRLHRRRCVAREGSGKMGRVWAGRRSVRRSDAGLSSLWRGKWRLSWEEVGIG